MDRSKSVQAIAVLPGSHFDTVGSVAIAAGLSYLKSDLSKGLWREWLDDSFTKSVRKIKNKSRAEQISQLDEVSASYSFGNARAFALEPMLYDDLPKEISKLQVQGLDIVSMTDSWSSIRQDTPHPDHYISVTINQNVSSVMSTGKTAAQVAHGVVALLSRIEYPELLDQWSKSPNLVIQTGEVNSLDRQPGEVIIRDNGLTEIEPGTATVSASMFALELLDLSGQKKF